MKILVVDDSRAMRTLLRHMATEMALAASEAGDGREALDKLVRNDPREPYDVVLVDWEMPRMNGLEFVQAVRRNEDFDSLKVLMITNINSPEKVAEAIAAGADDFLMKPFTREMLLEKLQILEVLD